MTWAIDEKGYSQRRACSLVGIDPRVYRYRSTRPDDARLRGRLRELAAERRRFGYRRLHLLLKREGVEINWKKLYRLYKEERLTVRKRGGRKRALGTRAPMAIPHDLSPKFHPFTSRVLCSFEPLRAVDATGWGVEPPICSGVPSCCVAGALSLA